MAEKCYRIEFTAHLHKLTLALKIQSQIQVIWKDDEKCIQSGQVLLNNGQAIIDKKITIGCDMSYNSITRVFQEKKTRFLVILTREKGSKQAGEIQVNLTTFLNENVEKKHYEQKLIGCPDKNAKLSFTIYGCTPQANNKISEKSRSGIENMQKDPPSSTKYPKNQNIKRMQQENLKIKQQLKGMQKLKKENEQLSKKINGKQFSKVDEIKQKIEKQKNDIEKMKKEIRANNKIQHENAQLEQDILNCKIKMMKAFNFAAEFGGVGLVDQIQEYCGIREY